jgi:hypothetical protein
VTLRPCEGLTATPVSHIPSDDVTNLHDVLTLDSGPNRAAGIPGCAETEVINEVLPEAGYPGTSAFANPSHWWSHCTCVTVWGCSRTPNHRFHRSKPAVAADRAPPPDDAARVSLEWARWWERIVRAETDTPPGRRPLLLTQWSELPADTLPANATATVMPDARWWSQQRKRELFEFQQRSSPLASVEREVMRAAQKDLTRAGAPSVSIKVLVLPVATSWRWRVNPTTAIVGFDLRANEADSRRLLTEIVDHLTTGHDLAWN